MGLAGLAQTTSSTPAAQQTPSSQQTTPSSSAPNQQNAPPLQLHDLPEPSHTPTPAEAAQEEQQRILMQISRLATMQAQWGPELSTAGLSIDLKEVGRTKEPDGTTQIAWQITGKGFPADQKLELTQWPLDARPQNVMSGIQLDGQGVAVCVAPPLPATGTPQGSTTAANPGQAGAAASSTGVSSQVPDCGATVKPGQPVEIRAAVAPGEAIRVALVGQSEKNGAPIRIGAATSLVPFPMANTDKGCRLQVIRGMKNAGMVLVEGTGFPAKASLKVDTVTSGQTRTISAMTNANGRFIIATLPALAGEDTGDTTVHMGSGRQAPSLEAPTTPAAAAPACDPSVSFHWGKDSYKPQ
ncbi:MAG TPA: hypothetical protein VFE06_12520 [Acidobacteriaceae bacterium]|nr:hypothetical protein [Acidobacteriaceae bacterium]